MRKIIFAPGEYYHIYNRGVDKRTIFTHKPDYERFVTLLYACNGTKAVDLDEQGKHLRTLVQNGVERGEPLVEICAYVLMPNHFHLMIREVCEGGISKFMQKVGVAYTSYFNKKYQRSGVLFQGAFKAEHASRDPYCSYIASYIHLNPIKLIEPQWKETGIKNKIAAKKFLNDYAYSSYVDYLGIKRIEGLVLKKSSLPSHCKAAGDFRKEVQSWLSKA
ncbi:MAG TPA: transposase [Candidatus Paceibacterota bacterium]